MPPIYPPYSEGTKETMSLIPWDLLRLQQQASVMDAIELDVKSGILRTDLEKAYEHLRSLEALIRDLDDDNALWLRKHEEDLDERWVYCSPRFRAIIVEECPSLPAKKRVTALHQTVREEVNMGSRSSLGSVNIVNLPIEIHRRIAEMSLEEPESERACISDRNVEDIKSLRLTCWDLHNASSCLLVENLLVDMTQESLARFDAFSRHPMISKGIRTIRVMLDFYDSVLASDLRAFAGYHAREIHFLIKEANYKQRYRGVTDQGIAEMRSAAIDKGNKYMKAWSDYSAGGICEETQYISTLRKAHELYQSRFATQEQLRKGDFVTTVAAGFARISTVDKLEIRDSQSPQEYGRRDQPDYLEVVHDDEVLAEKLVYPVKWEHTREYLTGHPCIHQLIILPAAIHKAGGRLVNLDVTLSSPKDLDLFAADITELKDLTNATKGLKSFTFVLQDGANEDRTSQLLRRRPEEIFHMRRFLTHLLDTDSLEKIDLDLYFLWDLDNLVLSHNFQSVIDSHTLRRWQNLTSLTLSYVPIHLADIKALTKHLLRPRMKVDLCGLLLLSGDWATVLDILCEQTGPETKLGDLRDINGEYFNTNTYEIVDKPEDMDNEKRRSEVQCTKVEAYLRGLRDTNPLRDLEPVGVEDHESEEDYWGD